MLGARPGGAAKRAEVYDGDYCPDRHTWKPRSTIGGNRRRRRPDRHTWKPLSDFEEEFLPSRWRNPPEEAVRAGHGGGDYFEVRDFVDSIANDTAPPIGVYEALDFTVPGLVSEESIHRGGTPLPVPDFRAIHRYPDDLPAELRDSRIRSVAL